MKIFEGDGSLYDYMTVYGGDLAGTGVRVAATDVDADGVAEVALANGPNGLNLVAARFFEADGSFMSNAYAYGGVRGSGGGVVCSVQYDADPEEELVVSHGPSSASSSVARIFDTDGTLVKQIFAFNNQNGVDVTAGDLNEDGEDELVAGQNAGTGATSLIRIFALDGTLLDQLPSYNAEDNPQGGIHVTILNGIHY